MMKRIIISMLFLLLLIPSVSAQLSGFVNDTQNLISQEAAPFKTAGYTAAGALPGTATSVFNAFQPGFCGYDSSPWNDQGGWIGASGTALVLVVIGITLVYILGQFMQMPNLIAIAKEEWFQVLMTLLRVVFIFFIFGLANGWYLIQSSGASPDEIYQLTSSTDGNVGGKMTMIDGSMAFSRSLVVEMVTSYSNLVMYNMVIHTLYSSTMWFGTTWRAMYSFNLGPVLKPLIDIVGMALQFLSLGIGEWMLHLIILCMIKKWTWTLFIPIGIFLRALPPTRAAGEALFAIIFALAIIYPFMFLVSYESHKIMKNNLVDGSSALSNFVQNSGILAVAGSVVVTMFLAAGVFFPFFVGMALNLAFELIRNSVYYVVIMSLLLPFLNIFITLTAAREIARFFSVDVSFMSFIKII
jgi:hypothetical protein